MMSEELLPCPCGGGLPETLDVLSDIEGLGRYQCKRCKMNFSLLFLLSYEGRKPVFRWEDEQEEAASSWNKGVKNIFKGNQYKNYLYDDLTKHLNRLKTRFHYDADPLEYRVNLIKEGRSHDVAEFETIKLCGMQRVIRYFEQSIEEERP